MTTERNALAENALVENALTENALTENALTENALMENALQAIAPTTPNKTTRDWRFWAIFIALCLSLFLTALDLASVSTALPTIVHDLDGADSFIWVSSAYTLTSTAVLPMSGRLADIFGRQRILLMSIALFGAGSAVTGAAMNMNVLIAGRAIQGLGSGGIQVLVAVVVADLIPLKDRGFFQAFTSATYAFATATGPFIGGAIAQHTTWRWLFYLNLPLCGLALTIVTIFLRLRRPPVTSYKAAFVAMDWIGNTIVMGSATSCILALSWAGTQYPWASAQVIAPLILGILGLLSALVYDAYIATHPLIPIGIINNRTSIGGYVGSFFHGLVINSIGFYMPTYFQAAKAAPPLLAGLYVFPGSIILSPSAVAQGLYISKYGKYRLVNIVGWCVSFVGVGLMTILDEDTPIPVAIPLQIIVAFGLGNLYATTFSVMAPLDPKHNASALSFLLFVRTISSAWAIAISGTILQNELQRRLPEEFLSMIPSNQDLTYSPIPQITTLNKTLQGEVCAAYSDSLRLVWQILLGFCAAGFLSVGLQKQMALHSKMDDRWGMEERRRDGGAPVEQGDAEKGAEGRETTDEPVVQIVQVDAE